MGVLFTVMRIWKLNSQKENIFINETEQSKLNDFSNLDKEIENDFDNMQRRMEISKLLFMEKYDLALNKLERLKKFVYKTEGLNYQYILFTEAVIQHSLNRISDSAYQNKLLKALYLSRPSYKMNKRIKGILTRQETLILISIAMHFKQQGEYDTALKILYQLEDYYKKNLVNFEQNTAELVWYHLSHLLNDMGRYEEGKMIAEEGRYLELKHSREKYKKGIIHFDDISGQMKCIIKQKKLIS